MDAPARPPGTGASRGLTRWLAAALVLATVMAFLPALRNGFVPYDDDEYVTANAVVLRGVTAEGVRLALTRSHAANWHPLTWVSHMLDVELFGLDPRGHHATSLALHAAAAALLLAALAALTGRPGLSCAAAALFALHPLRVESVAWVAERKDVLAGALWAGALLAWVRHARRPAAGRYAAALLVFALGLAAKPTVVTFPLVLLLLDYWPLGRMATPGGGPAGGGRRGLPALIREKAPFLALSLLAGLATLRAQGAVAGQPDPHPLAERVANALLACWRYLGATLWPADLAVFYPFVPHRLSDPGVVAAGAALAVATAGAARLARRRPWVLTGWLWYLVVLAPTLGLVQAGSQAAADRYTYLPSIGIALAVAWSVAAATASRRSLRSAALAGAGAVLVLLGALTWRQTGLWRDGVTLFGHAARVTDGNWLAAHNLGYALDVAGDAAGAERWYREALRLRPDFATAHYHLGLLLRRRGERAAALAELQAAVAAFPGDDLTRMALGLALLEEGRDAEALPHLREHLRLRPDSAQGHNNLAVALARGGDRAAALRHLRRAVEIDPGYRDARLNLEALLAAPAP